MSIVKKTLIPYSLRISSPLSSFARMNIRYLVVLFGGRVGYRPDDMNHLVWMTRLYNNNRPSLQDRLKEMMKNTTASVPSQNSTEEIDLLSVFNQDISEYLFYNEKNQIVIDRSATLYMQDSLLYMKRVGN